MDSLVLPQPPGPVKVSSLLWASRCRAWLSSASRPTKLVRGRGRRPGGPGSAAMLVVLRAARMGHSLGVRTRAIKTLAPRTLTWEWICATPGRSPKGHSGVDDSTAAEDDGVSSAAGRRARSSVGADRDPR